MKQSIARLQYITQEIEGQNLLNDIEAACKGGVQWVQLRLKNKSEDEVLTFAKEVKAICKKYNAVFIVNDFVNVAIQVNADGVHLGKQDMDITTARQLLGDDKIIGGSTNTFEDILRLSNQPVDYLGLGPFRFTTTKENLNPVLGERGIRSVMNEYAKAGLTIPVVAIGGIQVNDVETLMDCSVYGVAVSSAINKANNTKDAAKEFVNELACRRQNALAVN